MEQFMFNPKTNASLIAQMIVYIDKHSLLEENVHVSNSFVSESICFIKNIHNNIKYSDMCKLFEEKKKYYYFEKVFRNNIAKSVEQTFVAKTNLLNLYKRDVENIDPKTRKLFDYLSDSEKKGEIRPTYDLWMKMLWFLPFNSILLLFQDYQTRIEKTLVNKRRVCKKMESEALGLAKSAMQEAAYACGSVSDVINVLIINDIKYLCSHFVPQISDLLKQYDIVEERPVIANKPDQTKPQKNEEKLAMELECEIASQKLKELSATLTDDWENMII